MKDEKKLTVLITGAAAGIGNAVAKVFSRNVNVCINFVYLPCE